MTHTASDPEYRSHVEDIAALTYTSCEMGKDSDTRIEHAIHGFLLTFGLTQRSVLNDVASAIRAIPGQAGNAPEEAVHLRAMQRALGAATAEDERAAKERAVEIVMRLAEKLDDRDSDRRS